MFAPQKRIVPMLFFFLISSCVLIITVGLLFAPDSKIAYVDTSKLIVGFSEANKAERELKTESDNWIAQGKILEDSVTAMIAVITS